MMLYYALGGGLGHLTRARAVLHTLGIAAEQVTILTASRFADDARVIGPLNIIQVPPHLAHDPRAYRRWLRELLGTLAPEEIYLDSFPAGIRGEWDESLVRGISVHYLARLLKWENYASLLPATPPPLTSTFVLEPLHPKHLAFLSQHPGAQLLPLQLHDPPTVLGRRELAVIDELTRESRHRPIWLIVHSGSAAELTELLAYADEMRRLENSAARLVLLARTPPPQSMPTGVCCYDLYPASSVFHLAHRVVSACGFNVMRQMAAHRKRHRFMPLPRRFDDQFQRAAQHHLTASAVADDPPASERE